MQSNNFFSKYANNGEKEILLFTFFAQKGFFGVGLAGDINLCTLYIDTQLLDNCNILQFGISFS